MSSISGTTESSIRAVSPETQLVGCWSISASLRSDEGVPESSLFVKVADGEVAECWSRCEESGDCMQPIAMII